MDTTKMFDLSAPTKEEQDAFLKEFQALCDAHSFHFEPVPQFTRAKIGDPWVVACQLYLAKKTLHEEAVISPFQRDEKN